MNVQRFKGSIHKNFCILEIICKLKKKIILLLHGDCSSNDCDLAELLFIEHIEHSDMSSVPLCLFKVMKKSLISKG